MLRTTLILLLMIIPLSTTFSVNHRGRLGVGMSNQLNNNFSALSFKLQKGPSFAMGGLLAFNTDSNSGGYGAGIKAYKILFDEPQLNFYASALVALLNQKTASTSNSGFQLDLTLGSEFFFAGLNSLGFSFEFGVSMSKLDEFTIQTAGYHFITAGIHFYL